VNRFFPAILSLLFLSTANGSNEQPANVQMEVWVLPRAVNRLPYSIMIKGQDETGRTFGHRIEVPANTNAVPLQVFINRVGGRPFTVLTRRDATGRIAHLSAVALRDRQRLSTVFARPDVFRALRGRTGPLWVIEVTPPVDPPGPGLNENSGGVAVASDDICSYEEADEEYCDGPAGETSSDSDEDACYVERCGVMPLCDDEGDVEVAHCGEED
jgi:hypothetical protein